MDPKMAARWLATSGLVLTIIGGVILFKFGLTADVNPQGNIYIIAENKDETEIAKGKLYIWMGRLGVRST